jgi:hypothetical protein
MELDNHNIFTDPESFEEYFSEVAGRLRARRDERLAFIRTGIERLEKLVPLAEALRDEQTVAELCSQLQSGRDKVRVLETQME